MATLLLFITEVAIALYVHDNFVRPYLGDVFVVLLLYCFVRSFSKIRFGLAAVGVLLFSYLMELLQFFNFTARLGIENHKVARIILGNSFEWLDIVAYTAGFGIIFITEKFKSI